MAVTSAPGYRVLSRAEALTVPCPCGSSTRILTVADGSPCSLHVTTIRDSIRHYHKQTTEVYYILEGTGKIELNGDWHPLAPGTTIWIEPGTRHRVVSDAGLTTIVFGVPGFREDDEWFE